jgi:apolipoprotein N-acyltransferase
MKTNLYLLFLWLLLQALAWHVEPLFSLVAFVPLPWLLKSNNRLKVFWAYFFILTWHFVVVSWLFQLDWLKGLIAVLFNSLVLFSPIYLNTKIFSYFIFWFRSMSREQIFSYSIFIILWLTMEYLHHHWFMSFPWLTLGNAFGASPIWVQWYAYTGVLGGSLWIWLSNIAFYHCFIQPKITINYFLAGLIVLLPMGASLFLYIQPEKNTKTVEVAFLQSNIAYSESDSYKMKELEKALSGKISHKTNYLLLPETFFASPLWENQIKETVLYLKLQNLLLQYPNLSIIFGATLKKPSPSSTKHQEIGIFYEKYNVAIQMDTSGKLKIKEKSVFVPIEEFIPSFLQDLPFSSDFLSKPSKNNSHSFNNKNQKVFVGICYEMVNSFFVKKEVQKSDKALLMLSSEEFLRNNQIAMRQYANICRLRSIENKAPLIKSSSKGIAFACNTKGDFICKLYPCDNPIEVQVFSFYPQNR